MNSDVTDAAVPGLRKLQTLKELNLHQTRITKDGHAKLVAGLPNCTIAWEEKKEPLNDTTTILGGNSTHTSCFTRTPTDSWASSTLC